LWEQHGGLPGKSGEKEGACEKNQNESTTVQNARGVGKGRTEEKAWARKRGCIKKRKYRASEGDLKNHKKARKGHHGRGKGKFWGESGKKLKTQHGRVKRDSQNHPGALEEK